MIGAATALAGASASLVCYGGVRGPVDWLGESVHRARTVGRRMALTFDDGPHPVHTPALLDVLAAQQVTATFFVVGAAVDAHPALCRRIVAEGHELGNHTYHHVYLPLRRRRDIAREIAATDRAIAAATGQVPTLVRPPYGARTLWTLRTLARLGKRVVLWDLNPFDWRGAAARTLAARVVADARPGSIVLLHDARPDGNVTVDAVRRMVPQLHARGFQLTTVGDLLACDRASASVQSSSPSPSSPSPHPYPVVSSSRIEATS